MSIRTNIKFGLIILGKHRLNKTFIWTNVGNNKRRIENNIEFGLIMIEKYSFRLMLIEQTMT
jgi:hypothetical protein